MKVAIDIRPIQTKGNGISKYTEELYKRLGKDYIFLNGYYNINNSLKEKILNKLWEQIILPWKIKNEKIDVFHCTKNMGLPMIKVCKYVVTIHDLIPMIFEEEYLSNPIKKYLYLRRIKQSVYNSDIIITDSYYSKEDIISRFNVNEDKIRVVYLGIDNNFYCEDNIDLIEATMTKYGITGAYILGIGSNEPRKNFSTLLKAYKYLKQKYNLKEKLVVMGKSWTSDKIESNDDIIFTGYVDEEDLPILYSGADVFVYPSLYEGFGLPPLEAMACGVPVVTSDCTSIPEVVGDAALLVNPKKYVDIGEAIFKILVNQEIRQSLISKGFNRIENFKWEKTVGELEQIYREVADL